MHCRRAVASPYPAANLFTSLLDASLRPSSTLRSPLILSHITSHIISHIASCIASHIASPIALPAQLDKLCHVCHADEVVLFERATFLVISNAVRKSHADVHRFEKVSNIIKQFKLSCSKTQAQFSTMQVAH